MFNRLRTLGIYLILAAFFAPTVHAETVSVNPGTVGGNAQDFTFAAGPAAFVDIVWTDNKTLEYTSGTHLFFLYGPPCVSYAGVLLDAAGNEIPDTELAGRSICLSGSDLSAGVINLPAATVFSGIRLISGGFGSNAAWQWIWESDERPIVGQTEASGNLPPVADAGGPYRGQIGVPVSFDGSASSDPDGTITTYEWDFGDGTNGGSVTQNHTYTAAGFYHVTLTVTDNDDVPSSDSTLVEIGTTSVPPLADAGGPYLGTTDSAINFDGTGSSDTDGTIASWAWDFGDGFSGDGATVQRSYSASGKYPVTLTVTDNTTETDIDVTTALIAEGNQPPSADAGAPVTGVVDVAVSFDGSASTDPDGSIVQYDWNYGDGNNDIDAGPTPSHTYDTEGVYSVGLTVTDDDGTKASSFTTADIARSNQPPVADANGPYSGDVGVAVVFDGTGSSDQDGTIATYAWDFGDGETGAGDTVSHTYAEAGEYDVVLTVIDEDGGIGEDRTTATIGSGNQPPVADANGPYAGIVGSPVSFDGTASDDPDGDIASYAWNFGDGTIGSGAQPQHTYLETGVKEVTLTVTDVDGGTDVSVTQAIVGDGIIIPPVADAGGPYRGRIGVPVTFDGSASSDPDGTITTYEWDFGDGTNGGSVTQNHTYTAAGFYHVTLTVTDNNGVPNSDSTLVEIGTTSVPPLADAGGPYLSTPGAAVNFDGIGSTDPDSAITTWAWDFGDGSFGDGATAQKSYSASGKYPVTLTVTDNTGETDFDLTTALVGEGGLPPEADAGGPYWAAAGAPISFDGTGSSDPDGSIATYAWEFGDGMTGSGSKPSHTYAVDGRYNVTLTVTDNDGVSNSAGTTAVVGGSPPNSIKDDVVVDLGSIALWAWMNDAGWLKLNNSSPDRITTADMDGNGEDEVIADFASTLGGIFVKYNLGGWTQLANVASEQLTSGDLDNNGQDDVVIDAGASGLWARMNNTTWLKLNNASPEQVVVGDMDNNGADDVIAEFGSGGIFVKRNLGEWVKLHNNDPEGMTIGNLDGSAGDDLVVDFGEGLALQARMNDSSWLKLHNESPDVMTTGDIDGNGADDVLAGFASTVGGFWAKLNLGGWTQQNPNAPEDVVTADVTGNGQDDIVGDFGDTIGGLFIKRDQGAWVKQHNTSPDSMAPGELD